MDMYQVFAAERQDAISMRFKSRAQKLVHANASVRVTEGRKLDRHRCGQIFKRQNGTKIA
jgi:hypothetical protein